MTAARAGQPAIAKSPQEEPMSVKLCLVAAVLALAPPAALAADYKAGDIEIKNPWARATPAGAKVTAGYFTLTNTGSAPHRLVGATAGGAGPGAHRGFHRSGASDAL